MEKSEIIKYITIGCSATALILFILSNTMMVSATQDFNASSPILMGWVISMLIAYLS